MFEVEFLDGHIAAMTANAISKNLFAQVELEGHRLILLDEILDHHFTLEVISDEDAFETTKSGRKSSRKRTMIGCKMLMQWKGGNNEVVMKSCSILPEEDEAPFYCLSLQ